jgi:HYR domain
MNYVKLKPRPVVSLRSGALAVAMAVAVLHSQAQAFLHPVTNTGVVSLANANPAIVSLLNPPAGEGITNLTVFAAGPSTNPVAANSDVFTGPPSLSFAYSIILDAETNGIAYTLYPQAVLLAGLETYYFTNHVTAPLKPGVAPSPVDFSECAGVVTVHFVDEAGQPVPVSTGNFAADSGGVTSALLSPVPAGATSQRIYLAGGQTHHLSMKVTRGTDLYSDTIQTAAETNVDVVCDGFTDVNLVIPSGAALGAIKGNFDVVGEFEFTLPPRTDLNEAGYSAAVAFYGPFQNERYASLPGTNFSAPSSGPFVLANLPPNSDDPTSPSYAVYAQAAFRTNRQVNAFRTPILGYGQNPGVVVNPGATADLGDLFVIKPGYVRGGIRLAGPGETATSPSEFRNIQHAGDDTTNGIPSYLNTYGVYWSSIEAEGVDQKVPGAMYTASGGVAVCDFDGAVDPATGDFAGSYELVAGGLNGESSLWTPDYLNLLLYNGDVSKGPYYDATLAIHDLQPPVLQVDPAGTVNRDFSYCFSEVTVIFRSTAGNFYNPTLKTANVVGQFNGTNGFGKPANYSVNLTYATGTPTTPDMATNIGQVTFYLPEGNYTLDPSVSTPGGGQEITGLEPITLTVGCKQRISLETCLQLTLQAPACSPTAVVPITGAVRSCGNSVTKITYTLNGGDPVEICANCGADPSFSFSLDLGRAAECDDNTLVVTATDSLGGVSSVTTHVRYDVTPPMIQCPADVVVAATATNGAAVSFTVTATDNCAGAPSVVCNPPSGSVFPVGTNSVVCTATDACGNVSRCTFNVIVNAMSTDCLVSIAPAVQVTWPCVGTLQSGPSPSGPWTDLPGAASPYYAPVGPAPTYYRVRF